MKKEVNTRLYIGVGALLVVVSLVSRNLVYLPLGCCFIIYGLAHKK